jgi:putative chitinase
MITADLLRLAVGCTPDRAALFAPHLEAACTAYGITSPARLAAFLAQIGHESGALRYVLELADGHAYEGRRSLGNTQPGDGPRYRGRGLIQITGRANYRETAARLLPRGAPDFEDFPEAIEDPRWAAWSAADWWHAHGCNQLADAGQVVAIGRLINRGSAASQTPANGEADRLQRFERARAALASFSPASAPPPPPPAPPPEAPPAPTQFDDTMPAGEAPDWVPPPPKESAMLPAFLAAALPALVQSAPGLIRIFGSGGAMNERNAKAAEAVADIALKATAQPTLEGAVQVLQTDQEAAARYREQVHQSMGELLGLLVQAVEVDEKTRATALDRNLALGKATGGKWLYLLGFVAVLVILASYVITGMVMFKSEFSDETKALVLGQIVILGFATVVQWLFGSNIANRITQRDRND